MTARAALKHVPPAVWTTLAVIVVLVVVYLVGRANPLPPPRITTDALGPDNSETQDQYTARAAATIAADGRQEDAGEPRWALVSFQQGMSADAAAAAVGGVRISEVVTWLPDDSAQTPVTVVQVPAAEDPASMVEHAQRRAADQVEQSSVRAGGTAGDVVRALRGGCACVVGLVVRADLPELRDIADRRDVTTVDALPGDAVFGTFAVRSPAPQFH